MAEVGNGNGTAFEIVLLSGRLVVLGLVKLSILVNLDT